MTDQGIASTSRQDNDSQAVKITPGNRAVLKTLKDLNVKKARADHHLILLTSAIAEGRTIGGLRRDVRPQLPEIPVDLAIEWEEAHIVFTDSLTKILAKYWTTKKDIINDEIKVTSSKITVGTKELEHAHINSLATATFDAEVIKLAAPKPQRPPKSIWPRVKRRRQAGDSTPGSNIAQ